MLVFIALLGLVTGSFSAILCPTEFNELQTVHLPHPTSCAKFLTCVGNHPVEQDCPEGLYWNNEKSFCDYPEASGCSRGDFAQQLEKRPFNSTAVVNSICLPQFDRCPLNSNPSEQIIFLKHHDCRKFYACVQTHQVELSCPPNLYWNSQGCVCDYEVEAACTGTNRPNGDAPIDEEPIEPENAADREPNDEPDQSEDAEQEVAPNQEPEPDQRIDESYGHGDAEAHEPVEEPKQNVDEAQERGVDIARVRRAADGESSSSGSSGSESSGSESSGSESSGSSSSGSGSSGSESSGSGSSGGTAPAQSGSDVRTASSIAIIAFTAAMSLI